MLNNTYMLRVVHMEHNGGTKDYDIIFLRNEQTDQTVMLQRWGKVGADGQSRVKEFQTFRHSKNYAQKIIDDKTSYGHGYSISADDFHYGLGSLKDIEALLPSFYFTHMSMAGLEHVGITRELIDVHRGESSVTAEPPPVEVVADPYAGKPAHYGRWS